MSRREYVIQNILVPLAVNIGAAILLLLVGLTISERYRAPWWVPVGLALTLLVLTTLTTRKAVRRRYLTLKIVEEVSSSRCGDYFLRLAQLLFDELKRPDEVVRRLEQLVHIRRYPNRRFLNDLRSLGVGGGDPAAASDVSVAYLGVVPSVKRTVRAEVVEALAEYLGDLSADTHLVLYGFSSTICDGLAGCAPWLSLPVFLIEDLQYGVDGSLGEHVHAQAHLEAAGIKPILLRFDQIAPLCLPSADFVRSAQGRPVPVSSKRRIVAFLGCEAIGVDGEILIPSRVRGTPSETAKFVEVVHEAAASGRVPADVVVVSESFKVHEDLGGDASFSHAPARVRPLRRIAFMTGLTPLPAALGVEFVRLSGGDVEAVIDELGVHRGSGRFDMQPSFDLWRDRTVRRLQKRVPAGDLQRVLAHAKTAIFDLNGVLMDDETSHYAAFADVLRACERTLTHEEYLRLCSGRTDHEGMNRLIAAKDLDKDVDGLVKAKRASYERHRGDYRRLTFRGAVAVARHLDESGVRCYLVSACDRATVIGFLASAELESVFPRERCFVEIGGERRCSTYEKIVAREKAGSNRCVLIDDSPENLRKGRRLGMMTVGVSTTHSVDELAADVIVEGALALDEGSQEANGRV